MFAAVNDRYGPPEVVQIQDRPIPAPGPGEILVDVTATTVTTADWRLRASAFPGGLWLPGRLMMGLFRPRNKLLGGEFAGTVVAVGAGVSRFAVGDRVFGFAGNGAHAEALTIAEDGCVAPLPKGLSMEEAAALPFGGLSALVFLRDFAKLRAGERVLVNGASGNVGSYAVQIARAMGAEVTAVASASRADLLRRLGAAEVIDYRAEDPLARSRAFDVIFDAVGASDFVSVKPALTSRGRYVPLNFGIRGILRAALSRGRMVIGVNKDTGEDLRKLASMVEAGDVRPVIDRVLPFAQIHDAYRSVETRHRAGSTVLTMDEAMPAAA